MKSFENALKSGYRLTKALKESCNRLGLNYYKFLCLYWQEETGKKCTKRTHKAGEYKNTLECEAQMVSIISLQVLGSDYTDEEIKEKIKLIELEHEKPLLSDLEV